MNIQINKRVLDNGIRVIASKKVSIDEIIALKIFIRVGSKNDKDLHGITHLLEHLLFQNNQISQKVFFEIERYGGIINANTTKEYISLYVVIDKQYFFKVLDQVLNLIFKFNINNNIEKEKKIVLQEILIHNNSSSSLWDLFASYYWQASPLRHPIRGYVDTLNRISPKDVLNHYYDYFCPDNIVISCSGNIDDDQLVYFLEEYFKTIQFRKKRAISNNIEKERVDSNDIYIQRELSLMHIFNTFDIEGYSNDDRIPLMLISNLLSKGGNSKLYQELREKNRLVYSVESKVLTYVEKGIFLIYTKCSPKDKEKVNNKIWEQIKQLREKGISEEEIDYLKTSFKGSLKVNFETYLSIASSLGIEELLLNKFYNFDETIRSVDDISQDRLKKVISKYFKNRRNIEIGNHKYKGAE